MKTQVTSTLG